LTDQEAVGIISGQKGFAPKQLAGYVGQVSEVEALSPFWTATKRNLIRTQLLWGTDSSATTSRPQAEQFPLEQVGDRISLNGHEYPVIIRRVRSSGPGPAQAEALYYDHTDQVWRAVKETGVREWLARQVAQGRMEIWSEVAR